MTVYDMAGSLPDVPTLRDRCRAMAMVEATPEPDARFRRHRYDTHWRPAVEFAAMDNGAGDAYSIVFAPAGVFIRGFDHESPLNRFNEGDVWPGVADSVPAVFAEYVTEPSFSIDRDGILAATGCLWRETGDGQWRAGTVELPAEGDDGADYLLGMLAIGTPEYFQDWAEDYYQTEVNVATVRRIFALEPMTDELVAGLSPERTVTDLAADIARIGYPR